MGELKWKVIKGESLNLEYCSHFLDQHRADKLLKYLEENLEYFSGDEAKVKVFGKLHDIPRQQVAFGDEGIEYKYSGVTVHALPWPEPILDLKKEIANRVGQDYNFVLVNRYRDGNDYIGEHRDDESELVKEAGIVSISLGAIREFIMRHKDAKRGIRPVSGVKLALAHGSCLVMKHPTNTYWYHSIPKRKACKTVRLNLTFRKIIMAP